MPPRAQRQPFTDRAERAAVTTSTPLSTARPRGRTLDPRCGGNRGVEAGAIFIDPHLSAARLFEERRESMVRIASAALSIAALLLAAPPSHAIGADVRVQGSTDAVRVEAHDATRGEILAALAERFALSWRGATDSSSLTATFEGSLREVVKRVLEGYNCVISTKDGRLEVVVVSPGSAVAVPPPRPVPRGRQE